MTNDASYKTADRAGYILGAIVSILVYGIVLFPMLKALLA